MIDLSHATVVGEGAQRRTYVHPTDPDRLLKVQVRPFNTRKHWYDRPMKVPSSNIRELIGWSDLVRRLGHHHSFMSRVLGLEETSEGPALLVENAAHGAEATLSFRKLIKMKERPPEFTAQQLRWGLQEYMRIMALLDAHGVYNHCHRWESVLLCRFPHGVELRLVDYKSLVYRQFISPRFIPGGRRREQQKTVRMITRRLDTLISRFEAEEKA